MTTSESTAAAVWPQTLIGTGVLLTGVLMAFGAVSIPSEAGYGGVGPNFLPWLVAVVLAVCGAWMVWESRSGGFRHMEEAETPEQPARWSAFVWVSAGLLINAALITTLGFILSCALCYVLAVQGLRRAAGQSPNRVATWGIDLFSGLAIAAPVFWTFTQFLAISLPGLTNTGWL